MIDTLGRGLGHGIGHRVEDRNSGDALALAAGRDARDDVGSVLDHLSGVEGAFATGNALHQHPGIAIDEDAHRTDPSHLGDFTCACMECRQAHAACAARTAAAAASSMLSLAVSPASERMRLPSSALVPGETNDDWHVDGDPLQALP